MSKTTETISSVVIGFFAIVGVTAFFEVLNKKIDEHKEKQEKKEK